MGDNYETVEAGAQHCRNCGSTKYIPLENLLISKQFSLQKAIEILNRTLKKFKSTPETRYFSLYDEKGTFRREIAKWLNLPSKEKRSMLKAQRKLKERMGELAELKPAYAFQ